MRELYDQHQKDILESEKDLFETTKRVTGRIEEIDKKLESLVAAIENGISLDGIKKRFDELTDEKKTLKDLL
ncbi:MAG: hypothetical protein ABSE72_11465, partial [Bacteroidales bacterium]